MNLVIVTIGLGVLVLAAIAAAFVFGHSIGWDAGFDEGYQTGMLDAPRSSVMTQGQQDIVHAQLDQAVARRDWVLANSLVEHLVLHDGEIRDGDFLRHSGTGNPLAPQVQAQVFTNIRRISQLTDERQSVE